MDPNDQYSDKERCLQAANSDVQQTQQQYREIAANIPDPMESDQILPSLPTHPAHPQPQPATTSLNVNEAQLLYQRSETQHLQQIPSVVCQQHQGPTVRPDFGRAYPQQPQMFQRIPHTQGVSQHQLQQYQQHMRRQHQLAAQSAQQLRLAAVDVAPLRKRVAMAEDRFSGASQIAPLRNALPLQTHGFQPFAVIPQAQKSSGNSTQPTKYYIPNGQAVPATATANNGQPPDSAALRVQLDRAQQEVYRLKVQVESMKRSAVNAYDAWKKAHKEQMDALKKNAADLLKRGKEALMKEIESKNEALAHLNTEKDVLQSNMRSLKEAHATLILEMERRQTEITNLKEDARMKENEVVNGWANLEILLRTKEKELEEMREINVTFVRDREAQQKEIENLKDEARKKEGEASRQAKMHEKTLRQNEQDILEANEIIETLKREALANLASMKEGLQMEIGRLKEEAREKDAAVAKEKVVQEEALRRMYKELKKSRETIESLKREAQTKASDRARDRVDLKEALLNKTRDIIIESFKRESDEDEMEEEL